ncbi:MAG: redoxin domain-containing protein [Polyangiales bacterium]
MRLIAGTPAPDFRVRDWRGETHHLGALRGRKVWIAFFRYASCPLCNLRVRDMIRRWERWEQHVELLAIFQSPNDSIAEYVGQQHPPFPLIGDPDEELYRCYHLESSLAGFLAPRGAAVLAKAAAAGFVPGRMEGTKTRHPADFFVDEEGILVGTYYGADIADHVPFERVDTWLGLPPTP